MTQAHLFHPKRDAGPDDLKEAGREWGANCGPAALAALFSTTLAGVRAVLLGSPAPSRWTVHDAPGWKGYMTPTDMGLALQGMMVVLGSLRRCEIIAPQLVHRHRHPTHGISWIQIDGPWLESGVPAQAAYQETHFVAVDGTFVYDVNINRWVSARTWAQHVMTPLCLAAKRSTGGWHIRGHFEVPREQLGMDDRKEFAL